MESIDLTGCRNLLSFSCSSPALSELQAASCGRLYSLTLASSSLLTLQLQNCMQLTEVYVPASNTADGSGTGSAVTGRYRREVLAAGRGLSVNGCNALSADAKARLAAIVATV